MEDEEMLDLSDGKVMRSEKSTTTDHLPLMCGIDDRWTWNKNDKSHEVRLYGSEQRTAHFHPNWSNGAAGVRGTRALNGGRYYWEIRVSQRIFGTSMMFGVSTRKARLHVDAFVNMLGEDEHGWGLSHKGLLWHNGEVHSYAKPFPENEATTIGILFDGFEGNLTFYKDGVSLGVAFKGLHLVKEKLYPVVCSTAAKTEMSLGIMKREFGSLQERCRTVILNTMRNGKDINKLMLPSRIKVYIEDGIDTYITTRQEKSSFHSYFTRSRKTNSMPKSNAIIRSIYNNTCK